MDIYHLEQGTYMPAQKVLCPIFGRLNIFYVYDISIEGHFNFLQVKVDRFVGRATVTPLSLVKTSEIITTIDIRLEERISAPLGPVNGITTELDLLWVPYSATCE